MQFLKDHPTLSVAVALLIYFAWTLPAWLGQIWPLVSKRTLPEWFAEHGMPRMNMQLVGTGILTVIVLAVFIITRVPSGPNEKLWDSLPQERVYRQSFTNTTVE